MSVDAVNERNARVEADKAWETSWTRRLIVPAGGYFLSTLSLPVFKKFWIAKIYRKGFSP